MANQTVLETILSQSHNLPEIPAVALQVYKTLDSPSAGARDLAKIIMVDPALTAKLLRLSNSAHYAIPRKVATISEAVSILGQKEIKRIVFVILSHSFLDRPVEGYGLEKGALWENALTCATYAQAIAQKFNFHDPELVFIAALLRDFGKVALDNHMKGMHEELENRVKNNRVAYDEAEGETIGASHTEIGAKLAEQWNLADPLIKTILYHHQPSKMAENEEEVIKRLVAIVHLADVFTMMTGCGIGVDGLMYPFDSAVFDLLHIDKDPAILENLYTEVLSLDEQIRQMMSMFGGGDA